nr:hypothetical protein [Tanacetum cinerariifolium]
RKLERKNKVKVSWLRRLRKVGTAQRVESFEDIVIDDASKQGEIIAIIDVDEDVTLKDVADVAKEVEVEKEVKVEENTDVQGRQAEKVESLEQDKVVQALEIIKLKQRVRKLERKNKGEIIAIIDADEDVTLKDVADVAKEVEVEKEVKVEENTDVQGRQAESQAQIYKIDLEH